MSSSVSFFCFLNANLYQSTIKGSSGSALCFTFDTIFLLTRKIGAEIFHMYSIKEDWFSRSLVQREWERIIPMVFREIDMPDHGLGNFEFVYMSQGIWFVLSKRVIENRLHVP